MISDMEEPNMDYIKNMAGDDQSFIRQLLNIALKEIPIERDQYILHIEKNDYEAAANLVHKIKHKFSIFGMKESYTFSVEYEASLKNKDASGHEKFMNRLNVMQDYVLSHQLES
jgi:HPt (histidine-containing phosphotransfer) domain-containing protein